MTDSLKPKLNIVVEPTDFFRSHISQAIQRQRLQADQNTEFYLVDLMIRFINPENLFTRDENGTAKQEVLALLLCESLAASDKAVRQRGLRRLGDISLYTAGFFSDSLSRKVVDVDYYIGMGRNAYANLSQMDFDASSKQVYLTLSQKFDRFVDVLAEVSTSTKTLDDKNILRLYEVWLRTKSEHAEKSLKEAGIIPNKIVKPDWQ